MITLLLALTLAIPLPAKPARYVTDNAGVIPADRLESLDQKLKVFEQRTSDQVIVYIDKKVPEGTTLEEMGAQAIHEWGIGQQKKDNGVILFLFTDDRKMRIEVGYGLEGSLTDAKSKLITSTIIKPRLQSGDYPGAVEHGVEAILNSIGGESYKGNGHTVTEARVTAIPEFVPLILIFGLFGFVLFAVIYGLKRGWITNPSSGGVSDSINSSSSTFSSSGWSSSDSSSSGSSSSGSSSSGSSSDFGGGGGDGGGGGASDSW
jgi:uncharacterized protein